MKVLGVPGSLRQGKFSKEQMLQLVLKATNYDDLVLSLHQCRGKLTNSEVILLAALCGAKREGCEIDIYDGDNSDFEGVVFASPVYFGMYSSKIDAFIKSHFFYGRAVGCVSVGAKRNGGQETTNLYALFETLRKGAGVTGNGPPTAQYGGTAVGGNIGAVVEDSFGLQTSYGTGRRVAELAKIMNSACYVADLKLYNIEHDQSVEPCRACPMCPNGNLADDYTCIIRDRMRQLHRKMLEADAIMVNKDINKVLAERMRFIRRHHFELSNKPVFIQAEDPIVQLKIMTYFLRQNSFIFGSTDNVYMNYIATACKQDRLKQSNLEYVPVGYEDARPDEKRAYRD